MAAFVEKQKRYKAGPARRRKAERAKYIDARGKRLPNGPGPHLGPPPVTPAQGLGMQPKIRASGFRPSRVMAVPDSVVQLGIGCTCPPGVLQV
jgi:hypothetical protein